MNTKNSENKVKEYLANGPKLKRKVQKYEKYFDVSPEEVFHQFCPSRELDWIDGWEVDLLYTSSGYVEKDCIFTTPETNSLGPGLWIFTRFELNEELELVRVIGDFVVVHFRIKMTDYKNGTCKADWHLTFTALNDQGNKMVDSIPGKNPELTRIIEGLEHFLKTGEKMLKS